MVYTGNSGWYSRSFFIVKGRILCILWQWKPIVRQVCTGICAAPAFRRGATKAEARRTEPCGIRRTPAIFRLSEWKAYNVLNIHSENDRDAVRFEKAHSEHRISRLKLLAAIERDRMDRLRKKLGKIISGDRYPNQSLITKWFNIGIMLNYIRNFLHRPICRHLRRWLYNDL